MKKVLITGAGSVVVKDVLNNAVVFGNPAKDYNSRIRHKCKVEQ